jgi:hypothetical protein
MIYEFKRLDFIVVIQEFGFDVELAGDSQLNGTNQYLKISMDGYFIREGRHCLVFTCSALSSSSLNLRDTGISNGAEHEINLALADHANGLSRQQFYVETDTDFDVYDEWAMTINVSRGGRRGIWKYTKASAKDL